jgi:hypothetical protein
MYEIRGAKKFKHAGIESSLKFNLTECIPTLLLLESMCGHYR